MDVNSFLHSPDVAEYCEKIGHIFNPVEIAYLIEQSGKTINEKNMLFQELVDDYPDMQFHKSVKFHIRSSLHAYLRALIEWNKSAIEFFYHPHTESQKPLVYTVCDYHLGEMGIGPQIEPLKNFMKKHNFKIYAIHIPMHQKCHIIYDKITLNQIERYKGYGC